MALFGKRKRTKSDAAQDRVSDIITKIKAAEKSQHWNYEKWRENIRAYNLDRIPRFLQSFEFPFQSNRAHEFVSEINSILTFRDPKWSVLGSRRRESSKDMADILRAYLEWFMYHNDVREDVISDVVLDWVLCGKGFMEIGWSEDPSEAPPTPEQGIENQLQLAAAVAGTDAPDDVVAAISEQVTKELVPRPPPEDGQERHVPGNPFIQYVDAFDFLIEPGYTTLERAWVGGGWVAKRVVMPIDEAKDDKRFKHRDEMEPTRVIENPQYDFLHGDSTEEPVDPEREYVELWYYYNAPNKKKGKPAKVTVVSEGSKHPHWEGEYA